ncbi:cytoplasmic protein [Coprinopsis sp. MPI-PUGE-AT-0042]|nr:cytoplasmic protein [Coprinopsis sp. MPI-PUGE-AT-0042]
MSSGTPIIGSIVERKPAAVAGAARAPSGSPSTGFPSIQHRSKSAFVRSREETQRATARLQAPPLIATSRPQFQNPSKPTQLGYPTVKDDPEVIRDQISRENEAVIAGMSQEQIDEERRQIIERFGSGIEGILEKARRNRMKRASESQLAGPQNPNLQFEGAPLELPEVPISVEERKVTRAQSPPPPALSNASTRPSSRNENRRLRFAELNPKDVFVYESSPPSPRRPVLALPPPSEHPDPDVVSLGQWQGHLPATVKASAAPQPPDYEMASEVPEEGTPEHIRRRYFPDIPAGDPSLDWMKGSTESVQDSSVRFDLRGAPIPQHLSSTLPTHLGLHHHAEGSHAGYTLEDIFLLTRSTVPGQRAAMLGVLSGICDRLSELAYGQDVVGMEEFKGKEEGLRKRIAAAGVEAINERGNVGVQAIDVIARAIAAWDRDLISQALEGIMLEAPTDETIRSLPLDYLLPSISTIFRLGKEVYPTETFKQLLEVVQRLAVQNVDVASQIATTDGLLSGIVSHYILTPIPRSEQEGPLPDPAAIVLLTSLARTSRQVAESISEAFADDMLRFVSSLPTSSPYPSSLCTALITSTLDLYATLAAYGLASNLASTAMEQFTSLSQYVCSLQPENLSLLHSWLNLVQVWTTCAIDPHVTSPPHDITWSRIAAWAYHADAIQLATKLAVDGPKQWRVWGDLFSALAAWLEGSQVNGLKGGESERVEFLSLMRGGFASDAERPRQVVDKALEGLHTELSRPAPEIRMQDAAAAAHALANAVRLWLACIPSHHEGPPELPPFDLPYARISTTVASLLSHPMWDAFPTPDRKQNYAIVHLREFSSLLSLYLRLSRRLPDTSRDLWLAQAFSIVLRCLPGDEDAAANITDRIMRLLENPAGSPSILEPFIEHSISPRREQDDVDGVDETYLIKPRNRLGPVIATPQSIKYTTTMVLPSPYAAKSQKQLSGLPLPSNWMLTPIDHLVHSGDSVVFKHLPDGWNFSELDVTRSSLALALTGRQLLKDWKLSHLSLRPGEAILACMEIFMLEHGLVEDKSRTSAAEVFRDPLVENLMGKLLESYRFEAASQQGAAPYSSELETAAAAFLGLGTPFYQFYTDFVGLYDAISFSHPLFGQLLLPPISMRYAIDYRRLFWCDYPHIHRTVNVYPNQVLSADLREYLYPIESDAQVIGAYLSSLLKGNAKEFLRWVAVHHVASNIWTDLRDEGQDGPWNQDRAAKLFQAVFHARRYGNRSCCCQVYPASSRRGCKTTFRSAVVRRCYDFLEKEMG